MKNKKHIYYFIIILSLLFLLFFFNKSNKKEDLQYIIEHPHKGNITNSVLATGSVSAYQKVSVGAQVSGQIDKLYVKLGQQVKKGDPIAEIDSTTQKNDLETAKADLLSYQAQLKSKKISLEVANKQYNRLLVLNKENIGSKQDLDDAKNSYYLALAEIAEINANINKSKISVSTAQTNIGYTHITSPLDGIIISVPVEQGQTVNSNQTTPTIVVIADLSKMIIKPEISEGDITKVKPGQQVEFSIIGEPQKTYKTVLQSVDPATTTLTDDTSSSTTSSTSSSTSSAIYYYGNLIVPNEDNKLRISMTTQNKIIIESVNNVLILPSITIKNKNNKYYVKTLNKQNKIVEREINIGISDELNTQILSGISEDDAVISTQIDNSQSQSNSAPMRGPRI